MNSAIAKMAMMIRKMLLQVVGFWISLLAVARDSSVMKSFAMAVVLEELTS